ncbi:DHH family phosphoesterase [Patescibacteria group bacterium]|nr:DHH family phosphoesterase [Patescibacteria group bacterium]
MENEYFYSESTGLYAAREPLKIDARVIKAASKTGIKLCWDDEGRINFLNYWDSLTLLKSLGAIMLSLREYWLVFRDTQRAKDQDMLDQLQSNEYAERLNTILEKKGYLINRSKTKRGDRSYSGERQEVVMPFGHPGWFNPDDIDWRTGLPGRVELNREKMATSWKYWSFCDYDYVAAAIRGWVTSVGKPSIDLGIPHDAVYPVLLLRECRRTLPEPAIDPEIMGQAKNLIAVYEALNKEGRFDDLYAKKGEFQKFLVARGDRLRNSRETAVYRIREKMVDILGILQIAAKARKDFSATKTIDRVARKFSGLKKKEIGFSNFVEFVKNSRESLLGAVKDFKPIVFVIGHKNPDTDTVISSLAEAYRSHLIDKSAIYVPIVQGRRIPDEIERLLGDEISASVIFSEDDLYQQIKDSGQARWIMVDHNRNKEIQKFAISIIDHHVPSEVALRQNVSKTLEMTGSTTALVVQKIKGCGIKLSKLLAEILYGAALMDTENRSELKMTLKDKLIMDGLKETSGVTSDQVFYRELMGFLLNTDFAELLFARDYKEDWSFFGFAVAKIKGGFDQQGRVLKKELFGKLVALAKRNNDEKNLSLTILKVTDYLDDNEIVNRERVYLIFNDEVFPEYKKTMFDLISTVVHSVFKGRAQTISATEYVEFWGIGVQLSRKKTVPLLEPVVVAYNNFFFSPSAGFYVKREFLKLTDRTKRAAWQSGINLSADRQGRINNVTFGEAVRLLDGLGSFPLNLKQYWTVLKDAKDRKDQQMIQHLQSTGFVEFLSTVIEEGKFTIENPKILKAKSFFRYEGIEVSVDYDYQGKRQEALIPDGKPGLILPEEILTGTGFPEKIHEPGIYNDPRFWRYWSPDAEKNVATRGYIFLLGQPALDLKVHLSEAFDCLGIRPCCWEAELPEVEIIESQEDIQVTIKAEGEVIQVRESDFFGTMIDD